jgi:hypothetical protein
MYDQEEQSIHTIRLGKGSHRMLGHSLALQVFSVTATKNMPSLEKRDWMPRKIDLSHGRLNI